MEGSSPFEVSNRYTLPSSEHLGFQYHPLKHPPRLFRTFGRAERNLLIHEIKAQMKSNEKTIQA